MEMAVVSFHDDFPNVSPVIVGFHGSLRNVSLIIVSFHDGFPNVSPVIISSHGSLRNGSSPP